jgi:hypothetical protein
VERVRGTTPDAPERGEIEMTQYLMAVHGPEEIYTTGHGGYADEAEMERAFAQTGAFNKKLRDEGYWVFAGGLEAPSTATVVDGQGDQPVYTDGPYLETKEHIGGFWVIEAPDADVALALAAEASRACMGTVEVRPFQGDPAE